MRYVMLTFTVCSLYFRCSSFFVYNAHRLKRISIHLSVSLLFFGWTHKLLHLFREILGNITPLDHDSSHILCQSLRSDLKKDSSKRSLEIIITYLPARVYVKRLIDHAAWKIHHQDYYGWRWTNPIADTPLPHQVIVRRQQNGRPYGRYREESSRCWGSEREILWKEIGIYELWISQHAPLRIAFRRIHQKSGQWYSVRFEHEKLQIIILETTL